MSDDMMNNSEETAALFVARQKKKEEEKKAAEEQAERNLKEAEVARMEAELAERKKKATQKKIIALAVSAVVVVVTLIIVLNAAKAVSRIGKVDYSALDFNAEYTPKSSKHQVKITYPGELYANVAESQLDDNSLLLEFVPEKEKLVTTKLTINSMTSDNKSRDFSRGIVAVTTAETMDATLKDSMEGQINDVVPGAVISDVKVADYTAEHAGMYFYTGSFKSSENSGGVAGWYEFSDEGILQIVALYCMAPGEDTADGIAMRNAFFDKNDDDALQIPGMNPPEKDAALDGTIEYDVCQFTMKMPKDRFYPVEHANYMLYGDTNGAMVTIFPNEFTQGFENASFDISKLMDQFKGRSQEALELMFMGVSNKQPLSPEYTSETGYDFSMTYTYEWGGRKFMEIFFVTPWLDDAGKSYFVEMEMICPYENMDEYVDIYGRATADLLGVDY